jgi:thiamine-phosphate pyrophosphorylase
MLRYAITDRKLFDANEEQRQDALVLAARRWAASGVNFVQIREKDLAAGALADLSRRVMAVVRATAGTTKVLVNSRADVAAAVGADGAHLTSAPGELTVSQVRRVYEEAGMASPVVTVSCHSLEEVRRVATQQQPEAILFGPVFEKSVDGAVVVQGVGLERLRAACDAAGPVRVFALGGVTERNAVDCTAAGAAGVAAIRMFG